MKEYDYGTVETKKTFVNETQETYWDVFSKGIDVGNGKTILKGNPLLMMEYMEYERNRNKEREQDR